MRTLEKAMLIHARARKQGLSDAERLADYEYARKICNGIGAEWFPEGVRELAGKLAPALEPTAWIHDLDYEAGGGWRERRSADWRFLRNGFRAACSEYAWDQLRRYATMATALRFWVLLRLFGAAAFNWRRREA